MKYVSFYKSTEEHTEAFISIWTFSGTNDHSFDVTVIIARDDMVLFINQSDSTIKRVNKSYRLQFSKFTERWTWLVCNQLSEKLFGLYRIWSLDQPSSYPSKSLNISVYILFNINKNFFFLLSYEIWNVINASVIHLKLRYNL